MLTTTTLLGLLMATAAAFAITEHLKQIKSPVYGTLVSKVLSPVCHCAESRATIQIKLRHRDHVTVTIVDSSGHTVATIASDQLVQPRRPVQFPWNGRTDAGTVAPDGVYHPWVHLAGGHHTFRLPNRIVLDTKAPKVLSVHAAKAVLFAGPGRTVAIHYSFSEPAQAVVYQGRRRIIVGRTTRPQDKVKWAGRFLGRPLRAGTYVLTVGALDVAGNETPAAARKQVTVTVRYIVLAPRRITVRASARLRVHVETEAPRYTWRLGRRHGAHRGKVLRLHAPTKPGRYRLVVAEHGHSAAAVVRVRSR